jgi:hypothetical protein
MEGEQGSGAAAIHDHGLDSGNEPQGWKTEVIVLQDLVPIVASGSAAMMTSRIEEERGDPRTPPYRHSGPAIGYVSKERCIIALARRARAKCEGRRDVLRAGRGRDPLPGDNAPTDERTELAVTTICVPVKPTLELVEEDELARRAHLRAARAHRVSGGPDASDLSRRFVVGWP